MKLFYLFVSVLLLLIGAFSWSICSTEDAIAWTIFTIYPCGIMIWAFFREGKASGREEVGSLFWPLLLIAIPVFMVVCFVEEQKHNCPKD